MPDQATAVSWDFPPASNGGWRDALSLLLGTGLTLGLFLGIAHFEKSAPEPPPPALDDLRVAILPVQPPPVPVPTSEPAAEVTPMAGFELSRSESAVKIAVSPPELAAILPEDLSRTPPVNARFTLRADFKPKLDFVSDPQHVYQRSEVDRVPEVLARRNPYVSSRVRDNAKVLRVTLVMLINANGGIGSVRLTNSSGNVEFDAQMISYVQEWIFSPAVKNGRKVRCLIEQKITVKWEEGSRFEL
jgi:TonB family protein